MLAPEQLSERRKRILDGIVEGKSNPVLAEELGLTLDGIKWHVSEMLGELGLSTRQELAGWWREERRKSAPIVTPIGHVRAVVRWGTRVALAGVITGATVFGIWCAATRKNAAPPPATVDDGGPAIVYVQVKRVRKSATPTVADLASDVYTVRTGEQPTLLAEIPGSAINYVEASPDGRYIAAPDNSVVPSMLILDRMGRQVMKVKASVFALVGAWSPDSRYYAWADLADEPGPPKYGTLRIIDVEQQREITTGALSAQDLAYPSWAKWTDSGQSALFASERLGAEQFPAHLVGVDPATGRTSPIADVAGATLASHDGSRIAIWSDDQGEVEAGALGGSAGRLAIVPISGRQPRVVVPTTYPTTAAWSPDNRTFLAACVDSSSATDEAPPRTDLCLIDPTGQRPQPQMLTHDGGSTDPAFSPDGTLVAYLREGSSFGLYDIRVLDPETGRSHTVASNLPFGSFSWLPAVGG